MIHKIWENSAAFVAGVVLAWGALMLVSLMHRSPEDIAKEDNLRIDATIEHCRRFGDRVEEKTHDLALAARSFRDCLERGGK